MCMSVAIMSPTQYDLAYGDAVTLANVDIKKSIGWTDYEIVHNQTVKVYGTEKMHFRGECFLAAGKKKGITINLMNSGLLYHIFSKIYLKSF